MKELEKLKQERDDTVIQQRIENDELRRKYLAGLEAAKDEKRREHEREIDAELEPAKQRLKRAWLANNPAFTEFDFEKKAWILLRQNLLEERNAASLNAEIQAQMAKGRHLL
jgi:hypothetical protein